MTKNLILGAALLTALAGCSSSNDSSSGGVDTVPLPPTDAFGLYVGEQVVALSADRDADGNVTLDENTATVTLDSFAPGDPGQDPSYSLTLSLPDGAVIKLTDADVGSEEHFEVIDPGIDIDNVFYQLNLTTGTGADTTAVKVLVGFDLDDLEFVSGGPLPTPGVDEAVVTLTAVDSPDGALPDQGYSTYLVYGNQTPTLPTGEATYVGATRATMYVDGVLHSDELQGEARFEAYFDTSTSGVSGVNVRVQGQDSAGNSYFMDGPETVIALLGSGFQGPLDDSETILEDTNTATVCNNPSSCKTVVLTEGEVSGAFYGNDAAAIGGVFSGTGGTADPTDPDVEIVGGFVGSKNPGP